MANTLQSKLKNQHDDINPASFSQSDSHPNESRTDDFDPIFAEIVLLCPHLRRDSQHGVRTQILGPPQP